MQVQRISHNPVEKLRALKFVAGSRIFASEVEHRCGDRTQYAHIGECSPIVDCVAAPGAIDRHRNRYPVLWACRWVGFVDESADVAVGLRHQRAGPRRVGVGTARWAAFEDDRARRDSDARANGQGENRLRGRSACRRDRGGRDGRGGPSGSGPGSHRWNGDARRGRTGLQIRCDCRIHLRHRWFGVRPWRAGSGGNISAPRMNLLIVGLPSLVPNRAAAHHHAR